MPFIGKQPKVGAYQLIDSITTSATATYALTVDGSAYFPETARNLIVSLNGVTQAPESAYTVSGSDIVFASALTASDVIDYILVIGDAVDIGTPSDGTVGNAQLEASLDFSGKTLTFSSDQISGDAIDGGTISNFASTGIDDNATSTAITIDSSQNVSLSNDFTVDTNTLVVDSTNNRVGIGVSTLSHELQLPQVSGTSLSFSNDASFTLDGESVAYYGLTYTQPTGKYNMVLSAFSDLIFATNATERMRVMASGVLLVGGQTPAGGSAGASGVVQAQGYGTKQGYNGAMRTNMFNIAWVSSSLQAWVDTTNVGTFSLTSDYRIKRNIESMSEPALARVAQLRPVTYQPANFNDLFQESDEVKEGFIAHELQEVIPSAVDGEKDAEDQIQSLKVDALCAVLTKAIQEQQAIIEDLQTRLSALEAN